MLSVVATAVADESPTARYFAGLRQRGMLDLAEGEALRRLAAPTIDENVQLTLVAELARTFTEHAKYAEGREQADLWTRAESLVAEFLHDHSTLPRSVELQALQGDIAFSRGETLRWLAELLPERPELHGESLASLSQAVSRLIPLEQQLSERLRDRNRGRTSRTEPLTARELDRLLSRVRLTLGSAELERARLGTPLEKLDAVAAAERWLKLVADGSPNDDGTSQAQIALAEVARLAGKTDLVRRRLAALDPAELPDAAKDAIAAVSTALLLDERKPDRAVSFLIDYRRSRGALTGELRLLQLQALEAAAEQVAKAGDEKAARELRDQVPTVVRWTEAEHGGYWAYRARLAAHRVEQTARYGVELFEQVQQAETAAAQRNVEAAAAAFRRAEELAKDDVAIAVEMASRRASLLLEAGRFSEAADAFFSIAEREPRRDKAAEAHLLSAFALGRFHDEAPSAERREAYVRRLEEHRERYPATATGAEAALRLAKLYEQRRQYSQALPLLREAVMDAERAPAAAAAIARNYRNLLQHLRSAKSEATTPDEIAAREKQLENWAAEAIVELTGLTEPLRTSPSDGKPLSPSEAELVLRASQLFLTYGGDAGLTDQLLDRLATTLAQLPVRDEFWVAVQKSARPLLIVSLANRRKYDEAARLVDGLEAAPVGDLIAVVKGLAEVSDSEGRGQQRAVFGVSDRVHLTRLSDLRSRATDMLAARVNELNDVDRKAANVLLAQSSLADGRTTTAAAQFKQALAERPNDKSLLVQAAGALASSDDPEALSRARDYWRRLESLESPGSNAWFKARLSVIETSLALGDVTEARKLLTVTQLLHPQLGGGAMKAGFEAVGRRLAADTASGRRTESR